MNLREANSSVNIDRLMTVVGLEFLSTSFRTRTDPVLPNGFYFVTPDEKLFPGTYLNL